MRYALPHRGQVAAASGLDVLAGLWLLISPFVLKFVVPASTTNNVLIGLIVAILAAIRFAGAYQAAWLSWVNAALGLWTVLSPWILGFAYRSVPTTNNVIIGLIIMGLAIWSAVATDTSRPYTRRDYDRDNPSL